jgi:translation initiation factor IF-1
MKQGLIKAEGNVVQDLSNGKYKVVLDNGHEITAYLGGKIRSNNIRILVGDEVTVEMSVYDLTNGRIVYRKKVVINNED